MRVTNTPSSSDISICPCELSLTICSFTPSVKAHHYSIRSAVFYPKYCDLFARHVPPSVVTCSVYISTKYTYISRYVVLYATFLHFVGTVRYNIVLSCKKYNGRCFFCQFVSGVGHGEQESAQDFNRNLIKKDHAKATEFFSHSFEEGRL